MEQERKPIFYRKLNHQLFFSWFILTIKHKISLSSNLASSKLTTSIHWHCYVLSMYMLSFNFVIVCGLFEWKHRCFIVCFFLNWYWWWNCQEGAVWDLIYQFNTTTFVCLSQARAWIFNITWSFLCSMIWGERWLFIVLILDGIVDHYCLNFLLFCWYWWNCWPSLFKLSFVLLILVALLTITV